MELDMSRELHCELWRNTTGPTSTSVVSTITMHLPAISSVLFLGRLLLLPLRVLVDMDERRMCRQLHSERRRNATVATCS